MNPKIINAPGFRDWIARAHPWLRDKSQPLARRDVLRQLELAKIPLRYAEDVLDSPMVTEATPHVERFMRDPKRSLLLLLGSPGTGKTCAAIEALAAHGWCTYALAAEIAQAYRWSEYRQIVQDWCMTSMVAIDELGREPTDADQRSRATLWEVIERRWADRRKTILVSNISEKLFRQRYDEAAWDRIVGDGGVVVLTGASLRQRGAA